MNHVFNHLVSNQADDCSGVSTVLEIGFELLPAEVDADGIIQSLIDNRMNRFEVLVGPDCWIYPKPSLQRNLFTKSKLFFMGLPQCLMSGLCI